MEQQHLDLASGLSHATSSHFVARDKISSLYHLTAFPSSSVLFRVSNQNNTYLRSPKLLLQFVALVQSTLQASKMFNQALTILLQLSLFSLVMAEETLTAASHGNAWKYGSGGGIVGLIVLVLDVIAFSTSLIFLSYIFVLRHLREPKLILLPRSRNPKVWPPTPQQAPLVSPRLPLPNCWPDHLLLLRTNCC